MCNGSVDIADEFDLEGQGHQYLNSDKIQKVLNVLEN